MSKRNGASLVRLAVRGAQMLLVGSVLLMAVASPAHATSWLQSFDPEALAALATPGRTRIMLVAAGARSPALNDAHAGLSGAIMASRRWNLVEPDPDEEIDPDAHDADIVEQQRATPGVEAIWILRLFHGATPGAPATATVMIYAPLGPLLSHFYAVEGQRVQLFATPPDLGAEYLRQRISPVVGGRIDTSADREVFARDGGFAKDGVRLEPRDLYIAMGRHDLVHEYDEVSADRDLATIISGGAVFLGVVLFMFDVFDEGGIPTLHIGGVGISGVVLAGLGAGGVVVARTTIHPDPLDWDGKVAAANSYNVALKQRLAMPTGGRNEPTVRGVTRVGVAPLTDGLALTLSGGF